MARWPISDDEARSMYVGGRGDDRARWYARLWGRVFGWGLGPRRCVTLEVPGRRSGRTTSFPLVMADVGGRWYVVSMLGEDCHWVRNVRAAPDDVVIRRRRRRAVDLVEVPVERRGPILARYVDTAPGARPHIPVERGAPVEEFQRVADRYPVFEVEPVDGPWRTPLLGRVFRT